jgi:hypothetical protein
MAVSYDAHNIFIEALHSGSRDTVWSGNQPSKRPLEASEQGITIGRVHKVYHRARNDPIRLVGGLIFMRFSMPSQGMEAGSVI